MLYSLTIREVNDYIKKACAIHGCELLKVNICEGYVLLLVDISKDISISEFTKNLKYTTSTWITGVEARLNYWEEKDFMYVVSPEDRDVIIAKNEFEQENFFKLKLPIAYHHIILLTSRCRLLIPIKYRRLISEVAVEVSQNLGAKTLACESMRNHMHLLCGVPLEVSISSFIDILRIHLTERMLTNRHLRRIEGWSDISIAFTVSVDKISWEEHQILNQEFIHSPSHFINEMSPLYQRLNIPYVASLR